MNVAQQLKDKIEDQDSPLRLVEISRDELNDRSDGRDPRDGRYGWLMPVKATHLWEAPVCIEVVEHQVRQAQLGPLAIDAYFQAIGYWMKWHIVYEMDGVTDFAERDEMIEAHAADISPTFLRAVSEIQMRILDKEVSA